MKTPREHWNDLILARSLAAETIEARDAEWRRLVEEAQAELLRFKESHGATERVLRSTATERDRLKGELAEARDWIKHLRMSELDREESLELDAFLAAPPAEQAQGEAAPFKPMLLDEVAVTVAELAKRVDALTNLVTSLARDSATQGAMVEVQNKVAALEAERPGKGWVGHYCDQPTACPHRMTPPAPPPPEAAGPTAQCVCRLGTLFIPCPVHSYPPEAAGPGHAFVPGPGRDAGLCWHPTGKGPRDVCGFVERDHAVPPIPEGT